MGGEGGSPVGQERRNVAHEVVATFLHRGRREIDRAVVTTFPQKPRGLARTAQKLSPARALRFRERSEFDQSVTRSVATGGSLR